MELRHLRYFVAVGEELHISRAAERLHVTQPAVSDQIRKLEEDLGLELLDRTRRRIALTPAGTAFLGEARRVLEQARIARVAARAAQEGAMSRLVIGYLPASLPPIVPKAVQRLALGMPRMDIRMQEGESLELVQELRAGHLDAAIVPLPAPTMGLRLTLLGEQGAVAALPMGHRHAVSRRLRLAQIAPERIVVLPRDANRSFYDAIVAACHYAGLAPTLVELPDGHLERALLAVAAGTGMALFPQSVAKRYLAPGVRFVPMDDDELAVTTAAITRRDSSHLPTAALIRALVRGDDAHGQPARDTDALTAA